MSKLKAIALSVILATCVGTQVYANDTALSPVDMLLAETLETSVIQSASQKMSTAYFGKDKRRLSTKSGAILEVEGKNTSNNNEIDHIALNLETNKNRYDELEKKLTTTYGAPKSHRHNIRIWEITNSDDLGTQSKNVTIMAGEENGKYFVTIDRRGSETNKITRSSLIALESSGDNSRTLRASRNSARIDYTVTD